MELHDYPAGIERARLALGPVKERLRTVREELNHSALKVQRFQR